MKTLKTGEWKTAGADDHLSDSFRCSECGDPDEALFFCCRRICCRRPEGFAGLLRHSKAQGEFCDTTTDPPLPSPPLVRTSFGSLDFRAITRLEAKGIEGEGEPPPPALPPASDCPPLCAFASMQHAAMSTRTLQWNDHLRAMRRRRRRRRS